MNAATYTATEHLRSGPPLQIRALRPGDRAEMLAAVGRLGKESLLAGSSLQSAVSASARSTTS